MWRHSRAEPRRGGGGGAPDRNGGGGAPDRDGGGGATRPGTNLPSGARQWHVDPRAGGPAVAMRGSGQGGGCRAPGEGGGTAQIGGGLVSAAAVHTGQHMAKASHKTRIRSSCV